MTEQVFRITRHTTACRAALISLVLLITCSSATAEVDSDVRFRGAPTCDFGMTNVRWEAATPEYSYVTFDLYWSYSWRAKWTEPAKTSATGKDIEVENWDAAWVFVKFLPEKERVKTFRIRKGANTVVVEWQSNADGETAAANVRVRFNDAKTGKAAPGVLFDMEKR